MSEDEVDLLDLVSYNEHANFAREHLARLYGHGGV